MFKKYLLNEKNETYYSFHLGSYMCQKQPEFTCGPSLVNHLICFFKFNVRLTIQKFAFVKGNASYFNTCNKEKMLKKKVQNFSVLDNFLCIKRKQQIA